MIGRFDLCASSERRPKYVGAQTARGVQGRQARSARSHYALSFADISAARMTMAAPPAQSTRPTAKASWRSGIFLKSVGERPHIGAIFVISAEPANTSTFKRIASSAPPRGGTATPVYLTSWCSRRAYVKRPGITPTASAETLTFTSGAAGRLKADELLWPNYIAARAFAIHVEELACRHAPKTWRSY